ncbi:unnamed protein product [Anisakis simplex]|uniref:Uncharacterized protein n=1 Tax=Anisakis simplex TaxID=6269 RepID=A0A3P6NF23_ANISI|nr:unnamed protein product [Anisakis simplex]
MPSFRMPGTSSSSSSHSPHDMIPNQGSSRSRIVFPYSNNVGVSGTTTTNTNTYSNSILMQSTSSQSHSSLPLAINSASASSNVSSLNHQQKEKVRQWIRKEAEYLLSTYFAPNSANGDSTTPSTITRMSAVASALLAEKDVGSGPLSELKNLDKMKLRHILGCEIINSGNLVKCWVDCYWGIMKR